MPKKAQTHFNVPKLSQPTRLDRVLREQYPNWGRRAVQSVVNAGNVRVNGHKVWRCSWKVRTNDTVEVLDPPAGKPIQPTTFNQKWIIENDGALLAINKPEGLLSQSTRWAQRENLLDLTTTAFGSVHLFHRLDRDTSGVILFTLPGPQQHALNQYLDAAFKARTIQKEYVALVRSPNQLENSGEINMRIDSHPDRRDMMVVTTRGGKGAFTTYEIENENHGIQRVRLRPKTGRTHQLRVHLQQMGAPILGDRLYGHHKADTKRGITRLMLHAHRITLPADGEYAERPFVAPRPKEFK